MSSSATYDATLALNRQKLSKEENHELRLILLPHFHVTKTITGSTGGEEGNSPEDINDLVDYALAMISNNKTIGYITKELVGMEMKCCNSTIAEKVGNEISEFLQKLSKEEGDNEEKKKGKDGDEPKKPNVASLKGNALTMSGALGASRQGGRNKNAINNNNNKGNNNSNNNNGRNERDRNNSGGGGGGRKEQGGRGNRGGRGRSNHREAFDKLKSDNNRRRNNDHRGGDMYDDRNSNNYNNYSNNDRRRREDDRRGGGRGPYGGRGRGGRDMHRGGRGGGRGDPGRGRVGVPGRGHGGRSLSGSRRSRDEYDEEGRQEFMSMNDGGRGHGSGGRGRGRGRGRGGPDDDEDLRELVSTSDDGRGRGRGRGRGGSEGAKRPKSNEYYEEEEYYVDHNEGYGYGYGYDDGYGGYSERGGYHNSYPARGRGRGRGRGRFGRGGRFSGRGRGDPSEQQKNVEGAEGAVAGGDGTVVNEMKADGQGGGQQSIAEDTTGINHPSPLVQATFGGRGGYGGNGRFGRGGRGRGRFGGRAHVINMIQSKTWVRKKPDDKNEDTEKSAADPSTPTE